MASSAQEHQLLPTTYGATAAPPPTPSTQPSRLSSSDAADALSRLFHHLPPSLSLPPRLSPRTISPPPVSFCPQNPSFLDTHLSSFSQLGFFQLTNHLIPSQLAHSAESELLSLFDLPRHQKEQTFSKTWPLGYDDGDDNNHNDGDEQERSAESFCFDGSCSTESASLSLSSFQELTRELEKIGLEVVEALSWAMGFGKALKDKWTRFSPLMWVSEGVAGTKQSGRFYPYIVALQYQIRCRKYSILTDSGWVAASPQVDSVLVTLGDIAQVWSNGKLKKVRGRPVAIGNNEESRCLTMSLLITLPTDTAITISPLVPIISDQGRGEIDENKQDNLVFDAFSFEDYAWRVYHERFLFKDPLDRYRIQS